MKIYGNRSLTCIEVRIFTKQSIKQMQRYPHLDVLKRVPWKDGSADTA